MPFPLPSATRSLLLNSPEDTCTMKVVSERGQIGIEASASFHPVGLPAKSAREFVAAEEPGRR